MIPSLVAVVMGSKSDAPTMQEGKPALRAEALSLRKVGSTPESFVTSGPTRRAGTIARMIRGR